MPEPLGSMKTHTLGKCGHGTGIKILVSIGGGQQWRPGLEHTLIFTASLSIVG
jgi:hypothetical protein